MFSVQKLKQNEVWKLIEINNHAFSCIQMKNKLEPWSLVYILQQ